MKVIRFEDRLKYIINTANMSEVEEQSEDFDELVMNDDDGTKMEENV